MTVTINGIDFYYYHPTSDMTSEHLAWYAELDAEEVARRSRPLPSDLMATVGHAAEALDCYADAARFHHGRAICRGLEALRGTRAMDGAAKRAEELAGYLQSSIEARDELTAQDVVWVEVAFCKVDRSRSFVLKAAEHDFFATVRGRVSKDDREGPEFKQLRELEHTPMMYAAWSAVATIAEAVNFALSGFYDPTRARVIAAEEMASLYANFREWGL